ncbi:MAG: polysaccharide deacetylase family protein [Collinsella aerofaciens]
MTVKDGRDTYEKHEVQVTTIEPKLKVEGTGAIEYVKTWRSGPPEVWVGEQSGKTQDRGEVVPATDCVVECASVAPKGNEKYVALTFDEGPSGATKQVLQVLKEKASRRRSLSGDAAEASPATAKAIVDAGCEIGSNSYSDDSPALTRRCAYHEGTEAIVGTGVETMLLRAPYAAFDEQTGRCDGPGVCRGLVECRFGRLAAQRRRRTGFDSARIGDSGQHCFVHR